MADLVFSGLKAGYGAYKGVMKHKAEMAEFEEDAEDAEERMDMIWPAVTRLEPKLNDDMLPTLGVLKTALKKMTEHCEKVHEYTKEFKGRGNMKLIAGWAQKKAMNAITKAAEAEIGVDMQPAVDAMVKRFGPQHPGDRFGYFSAKIEKAMNLLNLQMGENLMSRIELLEREKKLAEKGVTTEPVAPPAAPSTAVPAEEMDRGADTPPAAPVAAAEEKAPPAPVPVPTQGKRPSAVEFGAVNKVYAKVDQDEIEAQAIELLKECVDEDDEPELMMLRTSKFGISPAVWVLVAEGKEIIIFSLHHHQSVCLVVDGAPFTLAISNEASVKRIKAAAKSNCAACALPAAAQFAMAQSGTKMDFLCCHQHCNSAILYTCFTSQLCTCYYCFDNTTTVRPVGGTGKEHVVDVTMGPTKDCCRFFAPFDPYITQPLRGHTVAISVDGVPH